MWSVVVHYDGRPVTGQVPCTDWDAAGLVAAFFAGWGGGRVSVGSAVCSGLPSIGAISGQLDLLEEPPRPPTPKGGKVAGVEPIDVRSDLL